MSAVLAVLVVAVLFLAYSNGANDNFKGVATLYGSGACTYRTALAWATVTTLAGSLLALLLAHGLVARFSGKGLVPDAVAARPEFLLAVSLGAALTVMAATRTGMPVSTTHALTGGLVGAGLVADSAGVRFDALGASFVLPLLLSPVVSVVLTLTAYPTFRYLKRRSGREARGFTDGLHFLSGGAVGFARGLNDAPKILALLLAGGAVHPTAGLAAVAAVMAAGGVRNARRVAETMSRKIAVITPGQGLAANLVTSSLVACASRFGLPVSTTHVAVGAVFGVGVVNGTARPRTVAVILLAWATTLPTGAALSAIVYAVIGVVAWSDFAAAL